MSNVDFFINFLLNKNTQDLIENYSNKIDSLINSLSSLLYEKIKFHKQNESLKEIKDNIENFFNVAEKMNIKNKKEYQCAYYLGSISFLLNLMAQDEKYIELQKKYDLLKKYKEFDETINILYECGTMPAYKIYNKLKENYFYENSEQSFYEFIECMIELNIIKKVKSKNTIYLFLTNIGQNFYKIRKT